MDKIKVCRIIPVVSTYGEVGFTLIEMLLVVAIIGLLTAVAAHSVQNHLLRSRVIATKANIATLKTALTTFNLERGRFPEGLAELTVARDGAGPFLENESVPDDAWGRPFRYTVSEGRARVRSAGPDGQFETDDDIVG